MIIWKPLIYCWIPLLIGFMLTGTDRPLWAQDVPPESTVPKVLRLASVTALAPGINSEDARLALEIIMRQTIVRETYPFRMKLDFISDYGVADSVVASGRYHFVTLTSLDYLSLIHSANLTPLMILSKKVQPTETLYLVAAKGKPLERIKKQPQRSLMIDHGRTGGLSRLWMDTVLWKRGYRSCDHFFTQIKAVKKTSQLLLSVFFGQADACIISASAYAVMAELNPQIDTRLEILDRSPQLVMLLLCATDLAEQDMRNALITEALGSDTDPAVRQALIMVQMERIIPFKQAYFLATEALFTAHREMAKKQTVIPE
jgi:ABC-type phosphate/phosphonate transport system substrate-binding protein